MLISSTYTSLRDSHSVTKNQVIFISLALIFNLKHSNFLLSNRALLNLNKHMHYICTNKYRLFY